MGHEAGAVARLADLERLAGAGTWVLDVVSGALAWSDGLHRLHGTAEGTIGSLDDWVELVHPDDRALWQRSLDEARQTRSGCAIDHRIVRVTDGAVRWLRSRARCDDAQLLGVSVDTTTEHEANDSLRTFLADAAHELRTPASAIGQAVGALRVVDDEQRLEVIEVLARQAGRLRTLTTDLIDLAQLEAGPVAVVLGSVPLAAAVRSAIDHAPPPDDHAVHVAIADDLEVVASAGHLDRVLVNLLTNAYRYGGPTITVSASSSDGRVVLEVADDGEGVPPEAIDGLFHAFRRGPQRHPEASGLGLAIVARLAQRFGGSASYRPGHPGAVFALDLERAGAVVS